MKMTVKEFAELNVITGLMANAVLNALNTLGAIVQLDSINTGKGRPTKVYDVPESLEVKLPSGKTSAIKFAADTGVDKISASSFLKFLVENKCIVELESEKTGRGRPTKYFELPDIVTMQYDLSESEVVEEITEEKSERELVEA